MNTSREPDTFPAVRTGMIILINQELARERIRDQFLIAAERRRVHHARRTIRWARTAA